MASRSLFWPWGRGVALSWVGSDESKVRKRLKFMKNFDIDTAGFSIFIIFDAILHLLFNFLNFIKIIMIF